MKQVYLTHFGMWSDVLDECREFILAKDADGVLCYGIKDGAQQVRERE